MGTADARPSDAGIDAAVEDSGGSDAGIPRSRVLIVDSEMRHLSTWIDVERAFVAAGMPIDYRRFFPHLTASDVEPGRTPYLVVVVAAGRRPFSPSSALRFDEVELARRFVEGGGTLVLAPAAGYEDSESGENDFFVENRTLEALGVPVRVSRDVLVGDGWVGDPPPAQEPVEWGYPTPLEETLGYAYVLTPDDARIAAGLAPTLRVASSDVDVLLRTYVAGYLWRSLGGDPAARVVPVGSNLGVATLARAGTGYVAVVPRAVLTLSATSGELSDEPVLDSDARDAGRTWVRDFATRLVGLARGEVPFETRETRDRDTLFSVAAPGHAALDGSGEVVSVRTALSERPVPDAPPAGHLLERDPPSAAPAAEAPPWLSPGGGRIAYGGLPPDRATLAAGFREAVTHHLDALMITTSPTRLPALDADALVQERAVYADVAGMARSAGARWFSGGFYGEPFLAQMPRRWPSMVGAHGRTGDAPAPLDPAYWADVLVPTFAAVGEIARDEPGLAGLHLDMELYGGPVWHHDGWAFSDAEIDAFAAAHHDADFVRELRAAPAADRLDRLVDRGLLGDYFAALEQKAFELAVQCRDAARSAAPDLDFMLYVPGFPATWFYRGLLRGLGTPEHPVVVLTYDAWSDSAAETLRAEGIHLTHLGGTIVGHFRPAVLRDALVSLARGTQGYWYFTFNDFSETNPMPPALHGASADYWRAVDDANTTLTGSASP